MTWFRLKLTNLEQAYIDGIGIILIFFFKILISLLFIGYVILLDNLPFKILCYF